MTGFRHRLIGAGMTFFTATGLHRVAAPATRGLGAILTFHRVKPPGEGGFAPNALLEITPAFLDQALRTAKTLGYRLVPLDEVPALLRARETVPFLALTFDDGYRDTLIEALPVLERHAAPFTVFATTGFVDRTARLWWVELEEALRALNRVEIKVGGRRFILATESPRQKQTAFSQLRRALLALDDADLLAAAGELCARAGIDPIRLVADLCMDEHELRRLLASPLAALGSHTRSHPRLARSSASTLRAELTESRRDLEERFGRDVEHLCFPYGMASAAGPREFAAAAAAGYTTAVTTRPDVLHPRQATELTALPRISVNGLWQTTAALEILLSGAAFALWNSGPARAQRG
jgi:peptidoglycan/xylan/chitin deacetylase (PgdA/CDA1 family)